MFMIPTAFPFIVFKACEVPWRSHIRTFYTKICSSLWTNKFQYPKGPSAKRIAPVFGLHPLGLGGLEPNFFGHGKGCRDLDGVVGSKAVNSTAAQFGMCMLFPTEE